MSAAKGKYAFASTSLPGAMGLSLVQQTIVIILSSLVLDGGNLLRACLYAAAAYWIGFALMWFRRGAAVTKTDVFLVRWGFLALCIISFLLTGGVWHLRGHDVFF